MKEIAPSQLLEILLDAQKKFSINSSQLQARKFNQIIDILSDFDVIAKFGYLDLIENMQKFNQSITIQELKLQISYSEKFFAEVKRYNQMFEKLETLELLPKAIEDFLK